MATNGARRRWLNWWIMLAANRLPTPLSPVSMTLASVMLALRISSSSLRIAPLAQTKLIVRGSMPADKASYAPREPVQALFCKLLVLMYLFSVVQNA